MPTATVAKAMALTCAEPQERSTPRTGRAMAQAIGISPPVQCTWAAHRPQAPRMRTSERSNDPAFARKVEDIVGPAMEPPVAHRGAAPSARNRESWGSAAPDPDCRSSPASAAS